MKTLRDEFAIAAMAGTTNCRTAASAARYCYSVADAMMEERKKQMARETERRQQPDQIWGTTELPDGTLR